MKPTDPTADYRKYPKPPNFLGIVIAASIAIIVILVGAYFVLGRDARKLLPHKPNPQPNAFFQLPEAGRQPSLVVAAIAGSRLAWNNPTVCPTVAQLG